MADIVLISGLSGAGRSGAADVLEDLGWYVVDNLPTALVGTIVDLAAKPGSEIARLALVGGRDHDNVLLEVAELRADGHDVAAVFLDASTQQLVKRYDATRRRHPLADQADGLVESIETGTRDARPGSRRADLVIDTTDLNVHQLKERIFRRSTGDRVAVAGRRRELRLQTRLPLDADIVMDVRFLPNPHWDEVLRPLTGHDPKVRDYVLETSAGSDLRRPVR